jgi:hypothetical protein
MSVKIIYRPLLFRSYLYRVAMTSSLGCTPYPRVSLSKLQENCPKQTDRLEGGKKMKDFGRDVEVHSETFLFHS